jgi:ATP-dependent helicase/nuclease subunit A
MLEMSSVYLNAFRTHIGEHQGLQSGQAVHDFVTQLRDQIGKITTPAGWQAWIQKADTLPWERVNRWGDVPKFCRAWATWLKDNWKKRIGDRWLASAEAWAHGIAITAEAAELLIWLVNRFDELYSREKRRIGRIDYSDMEEHAFNLLVRPDGKASDIAAALQQRYEAVLVDEFQDINPIQAAIVLRVSRESADPPQPNLFVVGDVKQSIYGFRMTDPDLFRQRQQLVSRGRVAGKCVSLQENFRSRPEILTFVNSVFGKLMQEAESKIAYDDLAKLQPGRRDYPPLADPAVELHLLDGGRPSLRDEEPQTADEENDEDEVEAMAERQKEAYLIAGRIQELVGRPYRDGDQARSLRYRDMVILLRSTKTAARQYAEILRGCGVPVYAELRSGYFASREIKDMLCLLRVLENMQQDIPLAAVLRSPLFGEAFSDADLVDIRLARGDLPFHRAVRSYAQSGADMDLRRRLAGRMEMLDRWRAAARLQPLSEVIAGIYQETGLVEYATLLSDGPQCRANLMSLYERARQFGQFSRQGLRRFVNFIAEMIRSGRETTAPTAVSQAQDVVRIMSIHTSKGLEFPVVFLADLGRGFNDQDSIGPIVMDREGTLGVEARDPDRMVKCDTLIKLLAAGRVRRQNRSEELRVLYVAMTRAKERLILVGTPKRNTNEQLDEVRRLWGNWSGPLPRYTVRYARNPLDWILPAVAAKEAEGESGQPGRPPAAPATGGAAAVFVHPREVTDKWQVAQSARRPGSTQILAALDAEADKPPADAARTIARLAGTYRYDKLTRIPAITPVTELKGRLDWGDDDQEEGPRYASHSERAAVPGSGFGVPRRLRPVGPGHAARQKGTATHLFLERVDLAGPTDRNTLRKQLADLVNRRLLSQVEADRIDLDGVSWFLNETDLGRQLRRSSNTVHRELPFIMRLEPQWLAPGSGSDDLGGCDHRPRRH